ADVIKMVIDKKHSRYPVYDGDLDNIVGVLHVYDVVEAQAAKTGGRFQLRNITRPINVVPETIDVADLLTQMRQGGFQMSVCVDEYGGTAGIVTMEDIIEEIVGEVRDEFE